MSRLKLDYGVHYSDALAFVESDDIARKFIQRYKDRTREEYIRAFCLFFNWLRLKKGITITPTEMLNKQLGFSRSNDVQERRWAANLATEFCRDNPDFIGLSDSHARLHWNVLAQFFKYNEVPFCSARNPLGTRAKRKHRSKPLSREDAKRILIALNQRDRAIALCMIQSGMGMKEILEIFNFMLDYIQARIRAGAERIKIDFPEGRKGNGFSYFTYISRDAIQELRKWLRLREQWIREYNLSLSPNAQKAIFITKKGKIMNRMRFERSFEDQLYARKVKTKPHEIVTHDMRKLFKTESSPPERNIAGDYIEFMMGHIKGLEAVGGTYNQSNHIYEKAVEREYEKLEPYINLFSGKATEEQGENQAIKELRAQNERLSARLDKLAEPLENFKLMNDMEIETELSRDQERTPLGLIIQYLKLKTAADLKDEVQKLKEQP